MRRMSEKIYHVCKVSVQTDITIPVFITPSVTPALLVQNYRVVVPRAWSPLLRLLLSFLAWYHPAQTFLTEDNFQEQGEWAC